MLSTRKSRPVWAAMILMTSLSGMSLACMVMEDTVGGLGLRRGAR